MNNQFESKDEEAAGKQEKVKQKLRWLRSHPEVTWSGAGIYVVSLIVAAGIALASWHFWPEASPPPKQNSASTTGGNAPATVAGHDATVNLQRSTPGVACQVRQETGETKQIIAKGGFFLTLLKRKYPVTRIGCQLSERGSCHSQGTAGATEQRAVGRPAGGEAQGGG
ncbi:hypothetical protein GMJAKD_12505 [Candidatus Electrothrix aarhusensis]